MYLLDFLSKEMLGEKRNLALKLLYDPLSCSRTEMQRWIHGDLCKLFSIVQRQCARDLHQQRLKLVRLKMGAMRISTTGTSSDGTEFANDELAGHIASQLCDRIREDFWRLGKRFDDLPIEARTSLALLYAMAELVFWLLFEVVREVDGHFRLTNNRETLGGCRLYLLGHQMARESLVADAVEQAYLLRHAKETGGSIENLLRNDPMALEALVDKTLDKCFGCHPHFVDLVQPKNREKFMVFRRRSQLVCYLFLHSQEELARSTEHASRDFLATSFATNITIEKLMTLGFLREDIEFLLECSSFAKPGEKILQHHTNNRLSVGNLNLKYALVTCSKAFFDSNAAYGEWFEEGYVANYLKTRIDCSRYAALEGLSSDEETVKYDVDAMIFDRKFRRLYFLQIKYRDKTTLPYLRDELREFSIGKPLNKAVDQLKGIRADFGSKKLTSKIKDRFQKGGLSAKLIDSDFLRNHSGLIILHTIENFDFGIKDDVAMYEWNTFRSFLKQEIVRRVDSVCHSVRMDLGGVPLDDPIKVAEALIGWLDSQPRPAEQPSLAEKLRMKEGFHYNIISTRVCEVLGRWQFWRPFLYLKFPLI